MSVLCALDERLCRRLCCEVKICVLERGECECTNQMFKLGSIFGDVNSSYSVTAGIQKCPTGLIEDRVRLLCVEEAVRFSRGEAGRGYLKAECWQH